MDQPDKSDCRREIAMTDGPRAIYVPDDSALRECCSPGRKVAEKIKDN